MNAQLAAFAQKEKAQDVIEVRVGQQHGRDGAVARACGEGCSAGKGLDLRAQIGRGVDEKPTLRRRR